MFYKKREKSEKAVPLSQNNRLYFKKRLKSFEDAEFMHANLIKYPNNFTLGLFQAPQKANSVSETRETVGMFYWAMKEQKATLVVCLTEIGKKCCLYFPVNAEEGKNTETFMEGKLVVKCKSLVTMFDGYIEIRKLEVKFEGEGAFTVTHLYYGEWTNKFFPSDLNPIVYILQRMEKEKMVFMHCDLGIQRSGILAQVIMNKNQLESDRGCLEYGVAVNMTRKIRSGVIKNETDFLQMVILTFKYFQAGLAAGTQFSETAKANIRFVETCIQQYVHDKVKIELDDQKMLELNTKNNDITIRQELKKDGNGNKEKPKKAEKNGKKGTKKGEKGSAEAVEEIIYSDVDADKAKTPEYKISGKPIRVNPDDMIDMDVKKLDGLDENTANDVRDTLNAKRDAETKMEKEMENTKDKKDSNSKDVNGMEEGKSLLKAHEEQNNNPPQEQTKPKYRKLDNEEKDLKPKRRRKRDHLTVVNEESDWGSLKTNAQRKKEKEMREKEELEENNRKEMEPKPEQKPEPKAEQAPADPKPEPLPIYVYQEDPASVNSVDDAEKKKKRS